MTQLHLDFDADGAGRASSGSGCDADGDDALGHAGDRASYQAADHAGASVLVQELERVARRGGRGRKILVARTRGEGKELLRQVALRGCSWIGFEVNTIRSLATLVVARRGASDRTPMDAFDEHALMERAVDSVIALPRFSRFAGLAEKTGFRDAVRKSVAALRSAGVRAAGASRSGAARGRFDKGALVTHVLERYESLLRAEGLADTAWLLRTATRALRDGGRNALPADARIFLVPGLPARGLEARLLSALRERGAVLLRTDPVEGLKVPRGILWDVAPPQRPGSFLHAVDRSGAEIPADRAPDRIELFTAASVHDELRGVLRRSVDMGAAWDEVEIVAADPLSYGSALHALGQAMGVPVNFAVGLPVERTRPGRVASTYFRWIESGFQESLLRSLVEAGDVTPPRPRGGWKGRRRLGGPRLARALRRLRIGWGRDRYLARIEHALEDIESRRRGRFETERQFARRTARDCENLRALRRLLRPVLLATPATDGQASPSQVAAGARMLLARLAPGTDTDETARQRLQRQLERIEATATRTTDFSSASAIVQSYLQIRIPAPRAEGSAPWGSAPGHLYLTDLRHGGATGRRFTFIVGLDAKSVLGSLHEDPLIGDEERFRLGRGELPLASERAAEARFNFAQLFARLRGTVVLSYPCWDPAESRELTPAPEMLQALRLRNVDSGLNFDDLRRHLGLAESRLPRPEIAADLDAGDVWLRALAVEAGPLREGLEAIEGSYPRLGAGLAFLRALDESEATVHTGFLGTHSPPLSYQNIADRTLSASGLETLGACPRRFLLSYVVRASAPDDPEFDPDRWLNPLERGSLLHAVYEETLAGASARGIDPGDDRFMELALGLVDAKGAAARFNTPSPSEALYEWEMEALRNDARSFVEMIREERPAWRELEWRFGMEEKVRIKAGEGSVLVRGVVDRVDDRGTHLRVVDYKTGGGYRYSGKSGVYNGGRRLQHFVYTAAVAAAEAEAAERAGRPPREVDAMEYHFPTRRGENQIRRYAVAQLRNAGHLVDTLLGGVARGWFPATDEPREDCRFCDYQEVCGVRAGEHGAVQCGVAEWTAQNLGAVDELKLLRKARGF